MGLKPLFFLGNPNRKLKLTAIDKIIAMSCIHCRWKIKTLSTSFLPVEKQGFL